jgi:hypothetical protein
MSFQSEFQSYIGSSEKFRYLGHMTLETKNQHVSLGSNIKCTKLRHVVRSWVGDKRLRNKKNVPLNKEKLRTSRIGSDRFAPSHLEADFLEGELVSRRTQEIFLKIIRESPIYERENWRGLPKVELPPNFERSLSEAVKDLVDSFGFHAKSLDSGKLPLTEINGMRLHVIATNTLKSRLPLLGDHDYVELYGHILGDLKLLCASGAVCRGDGVLVQHDRSLWIENRGETKGLAKRFWKEPSIGWVRGQQGFSE